MAGKVTFDTKRIAYNIPHDVALWEVASTCHILMALEKTQDIAICIYGLPMHTEAYQFCECAGFTMMDRGNVDLQECDDIRNALAYGDAYRKLENSNVGYPVVLAECSGLDTKSLDLTQPPYYPMTTDMQDNAIILCPSAIRRETDIGVNVWRSIARHLRSYGYPVYIIGPRGYRMDEAAFTEYEVKSEASVGEKLGLISTAKLVVGTANEWTWAAAGFNRPIAIPYPDHLPPRRWFPFVAESIGRIACEMDKLHPPLVLAGVRQLLKLI